MSTKPKLLLAMLASEAAVGAALGLLPRLPAAGVPLFALVLLTSFFPFAWYRLDAEQRGYPRTWLLNVAIIGFAAFGFPYYFVRSRGIVGGALATAAGFAFLVLSLVACVVATTVVLGLRGEFTAQ